MKTEDEQTAGHRAVQLSGAFAFLVGRQYDIVVVVRFKVASEQQIKQIQLFYSESARVSTFVFDESDSAYNGSRDVFLATAIQGILTEIKSRTLSQDEFLVWYYTENERDAIESEAGRFLLDHKAYQRFIDELAVRSRIIDLAAAAD